TRLIGLCRPRGTLAVRGSDAVSLAGLGYESEREQREPGYIGSVHLVPYLDSQTKAWNHGNPPMVRDICAFLSVVSRACTPSQWAAPATSYYAPLRLARCRHPFAEHIWNAGTDDGDYDAQRCDPLC